MGWIWEGAETDVQSNISDQNLTFINIPAASMVKLILM